jgi:pimeloyl-ACP methyl ester carboxylesterase
MSDFGVRQLETARGCFGLREAGPADAPPLMLVHGWPESSYCWKGVAERLSDEFRILAPDLRGLGDSERTPEREAYTKQALGADILSILDALDIDACPLAGHDWGGAAVQETALAAPERVPALILLNIVVLPNARGNLLAQQATRERAMPYVWYQYFQSAPGLAEAMIPGNERAWLSYFLRAWSDAGYPDDAFEEHLRCYAIEGTATTGANFYRCFKGDMARWRSLAGARFQMPGLYIYGNKDPVILPEFTHHLDDVFDDIRLEELVAAHFVQEEKPAEVAALIREFVKEKTGNGT